MTFSVGLYRTALLLLASLMLSGCLPSAPRDEEKEYHFLAGKNRVNTMDFPGAIESFEKAVEVNPKSAPAHFELGWLFDQKESDPAAAIYHYERYIKLLPNSGKEEMVKTRILACKQQLAQTVSLGPVTEKLQRELEKLLVEKEKLLVENKGLHDQVEGLRADVARLQDMTNRAGAGSLAPRLVQPSVSSQSKYTARLQELTNQTSAGPVAKRPVPPSASSQPGVIGASPSGPTNPGRTPIPPAANARTHIVKAGETPILIARKYNVRLEALKAANPKLDARHLRVGQSLAIPAP
jgi:LysM repeat protein